jgi:hypothetical protein
MIVYKKTAGFKFFLMTACLSTLVNCSSIRFNNFDNPEDINLIRYIDSENDGRYEMAIKEEVKYIKNKEGKMEKTVQSDTLYFAQPYTKEEIIKRSEMNSNLRLIFQKK